MQKFLRKRFQNEIEALEAEDPYGVLHPLRQAQIKQSLMARITAVPQLQNTFWNRFVGPLTAMSPIAIRYGFAVLVLFTATGIGVVYTANGAAPGDKLYGLKLKTEKVQFAMTLSDESRALLQSKIIQARIEESNETEADISMEHSARLNQAIETLHDVEAKLEAKGNVQAAAQVHTNLEKFKQTAADLEEKILGKQEAKIDEDHPGQGSVRGQSMKNSDDHNPPGLENRTDVQINLNTRGIEF